MKKRLIFKYILNLSDKNFLNLNFRLRKIKVQNLETKGQVLRFPDKNLFNEHKNLVFKEFARCTLGLSDGGNNIIFLLPRNCNKLLLALS